MIRAALLLLAGCVMSAALMAEPESAPEAPDAMVRRLTTEVMQILSEQAQDGPLDSESKQRIQAIVEPVFDLERMTAIAVGAAWRQATDAQRQRLQTEYRALLLRAYSVSITRSRLPEVEFKPFRMEADDRRALVRTVVTPSGSPPIAVDYRLGLRPDGWKVYDVLTDGVSLAVTYRNVFAQEVAQHGIDGLIDMIARKNRDETGGDGS